MNIKNTKLANTINTLYKSFRFHDFFKSHFDFIMRFYIKKARRKQLERTNLISHGKVVKVAFMFQTPAVWKYDCLYRIMEQDGAFDPVVVLTPYNVNLFYDMNETMRVIEQSIHYVQNKRYHFISSFNATTRRWLDIKSIVDPDVVFFSKPYKDTLYQYHLYNFTDRLTCYVPYGFFISNHYRENSNFPFHNLLWKFFAETEYQKEVSEELAVNKGDNVVVTGCLPMENIMRKDYTPKDVWKPQEKIKKRIIWAPHHTVDYLFNFSNFMVYAETMLSIAEKYKDVIQIAFKPHPVLKFRLINLWGEQKTDEYYKRWEEMPNAQLETGDYVDLFLTSDAIIHDSGSFLLEYLHLPQKPALYLVRDRENLYSFLNSFSTKAFELHYHAENIDQIEAFINNVVIQGDDPMRVDREKFYNDYLYPKDGVMPSQKIINTLKDVLQK